MHLGRLFDVALEEDHTGWVERPQHQAQPRRNPGPVEAHDHELADLLAEFKPGSGGHKVEEGSVTIGTGEFR